MHRPNYKVMIRKVSLILVLLASCSGNQTERKSDKLRQVRIAVIGETSGADFVAGIGTVRYRREIPLAFTSNGKIASILVREGDAFRKGHLLAALDLSTVNASLVAAQASLKRAQAEFDRTEKLLVGGWVTKSYMEQAQFELSLARENMNAARFQSTNARIVAPANGLVLDRLAEPSQTVSAGQAVILVGEIESDFVLRVALADYDVSRMKPGMSVDVAIAALGNRTILAKLIEIGGQSDSMTSKFYCLFLLPWDAKLRTGQFGKVSFTLPSETIANSIVPVSAVLNVRADEGFVYVVNGKNQAVLRRVGIHEVRTDGVAIGTGLVRGERVIVSGVDRLQNGEKVSISAMGQ